MEKFDDKLYTTLRDDATIRGYTGYTASDVRIYVSWSEEEHEVNDVYPAYITYHKVTDVPPYMDTEEEIYQISIFSRSQQTNLNIFSRIDTLLNDQVLVLASGTNTKIHRETHFPLYEKETQLHHYVIQYRVFYYG